MLATMSKKSPDVVHDSTHRLKHVDSMNLTRFRNDHQEKLVQIEDTEELQEEESNSGSVRFCGELTEFIEVVLPCEKAEAVVAQAQEQAGPSTVTEILTQDKAPAPMGAEELKRHSQSSKRVWTPSITGLEPEAKRPKLDE